MSGSLFWSAERNNLCNFGRGYYEKQFCEFILNLGQWFRRRCLLNDLLSVALVALLLCTFERGHHWKHSCEVIYNLYQWFRRCRLKEKFTHIRTDALTVGIFLGSYSVRKSSQESVSTQQIPVHFYRIILIF